MEESIFPLFILFVIAWFVPMVLSWFEVTKVPSVIVEIVIGVIVGPFLLNLIPADNPILSFLSDLGFLVLIFLSGLALDIDKIIHSLPSGGLRKKDFISNAFLLASFIYVGAILLSFPVVWGLQQLYDIDLIFFVIALPSVALSIIVPIIKADGELSRKYGQVILLEGAIGTIMTILLIAIYSGINQNGFQFELLLFLIVFVVFFIAYKVGNLLMRLNRFQRLMYNLEHAASQIRIRGAVAVLFLFVVIASLVDTEPVLGAFFAGALLSMFLSKERSALIFKLDGMAYGFFIPIFFVMVGVELDLAALNDVGAVIAFILTLTVSFYLIQVVPSLIMTFIFGLRKSIGAGILMTSRLGLTIAVAQIGLSSGIISSAENAALVVAAILTCLLSPLLYKIIHSTNEDAFYSIYIIGGGAPGKALAQRLKLHGTPYLVVESNPNKWYELQRNDIESINDDYEDISTYRSLKIRPVDTVVVVSDSEDRNIKITDIVKNQLHHSKVISVTSKPEIYRSEPKMDGVTVVNAYDVIASQLENEILRPDTLHALTDSFGGIIVKEITVKSKSLDRKQVKDIPFHPSGSLILVKRNDEVFVPHGNTHILLGDIVTAIGNNEALHAYKQLLQK